MRFRNLPLGALALAVVAGIVYRADPTILDRLPLGKPAEAAPAETAPPPAFVMPVPVARVVKTSVPIVLDYAARTEAVRGIALQAKVSAYVVEQRVADGTDVKAGDLPLQARPARLPGGARPGQRPDRAGQASLDYQTASFTRGDALSKSGYIAKDSLDQRSSACARPRPPWSPTAPPSAPHSSTSPIRRSGRPSRGGSAATRPPSARWRVPARPCSTRWCRSIPST